MSRAAALFLRLFLLISSAHAMQLVSKHNATLAHRSNASAAMDGKPALFVHIHKAGGTMACFVAKRFGARTPNVPSCNWNGFDSYGQSCRGGPYPSCAERASQYRLERWTFGSIERELRQEDVCFNDFRYGVLLRDPLQLMQSHLNFNYKFFHGARASLSIELFMAAISNGAAPLHEKVGEMGLCSGWKFMDNFQVRVLSGAMEVPAGQLTEEHLQLAKSRLAQFTAVEKLENMQDLEVRDAFFATLGLPTGRRLKHVRLNQAKGYREQFSAQQLEWLKEQNHW
eukprot:CAMPEP_0178431908 /NCGR_PEP_ID=MMETSP0689_2-20121128/32105_1 /TAXON_ID=160604 /ORGANISM="Amphidinium massartii, Strain CS-259" /LENGTH=283 /DNA_ID=CAMNT_0020053865 /DNA_START=56 /DNA_END=904 /DNA_ORIENTATION=-